MSFQKGDKIELDVSQLESKKINVRWSQKFNQTSKQYYLVQVKNSNQDGNPGLLFIQRDYMEMFKNELSEQTFTVNGKYQYGTRIGTGGKERFLIYHDKSQKMYTWRFFDGIISGLRDEAKGILEPLGIPTELSDLQRLYEGPAMDF